MSLEQMRKDYSASGLSKQEVDPDPLVQFSRWFAEANQPDLPEWVEVNAMALSTCGGNWQVTSRIVLLKGIEQGKLLFYTNYDSDKAQQIELNSRVSLCIHWPHLQRQVRVEGTAAKTGRGQSERYFQSRPRGSQLGAHVSRQSAVVESRADLEQRMQELDKQYEGEAVPCPENWGGYEVTASRFEFWQGRPNRLHDRIEYGWRDSQWIIQRLAP